MECYILDQSFNKINIVEGFSSFIWTERYSAYGDFELTLDSNAPVLADLQMDNYLQITDSDETMIVESVEIKKSNTEDYSKIRGRSLDSIMTRRQIIQDFNNAPTAIGLLFAHVIAELSNSIINVNKNIPRFFVNQTTNGITDRTGYQYEFKGNSLYTAVKTICEDLGAGFKIRMDERGYMTFQVYGGTDRTWASAATIPPVVFSVNMSNLNTLDYFSTIEAFSNFAYIDLAPSDFLSTKHSTWITASEPVGMARREAFIDGSSIDKDYTAAQKQTQAIILGQQELRASVPIVVFDADIDHTRPPTYGKDYYMGDKVVVESELGINTTYRVTEFIRSYATEGTSMYPTFAVA